MTEKLEHRKSRLMMQDVDEDFGGLKSAYVEVTLKSKPYIAKVMDVSESGLRLVVDMSVEDSPKPGALIHNMVLGTALSRNTLERMTLRRITQVEDGPLELGLEGEDSETRATLWRVFNELRTIKAAETYSEFDPASIERIPARGEYTEIARRERLEFARRISSSSLETIDEIRVEPESLTGNIENLIGSVEIPVGIAGPLLFRGENVLGPIYAPMATTEGALVASATRGATALTRAGGVTTRILRQRMIRVPLFVFESSASASVFRSWVLDHVEEIRAQTRLVSRHARLMQVVPDQIGPRVNVMFTYETGDAAGQNMTTSCTWKACQWILDELQYYPDMIVERFTVDGNISGDKKVNFQSFLSGRGTRVTAEALIPHEVLQNVLKVSPKELRDTHENGVAAGISIGMVGSTVNISNVIGAMFTATGQDIASVHESSLGNLRIHIGDDASHVSLDLPALIVGTVGGGTSLPNQSNYLEMMGCKGSNRAGRLAEIIAGYCLALDISTLAAIASGQFASAHDRLGRNRPVKWFTASDLNHDFFNKGFQRAHSDSGLTVTGVEDIEIVTGSSIITELTARKVDKLVGLFPKRVEFTKADGESSSTDVMVKVKPTDQEVILMSNGIAQMCGGKLAPTHNKFKELIGAKGCHIRELAIYKQPHPYFRKLTPKVYDCHQDPDREAYLIVLEDLSGLELMNTADDITAWTDEHYKAAIEGMAELHSICLGHEDALRAQPWIGEVMTTERMVEMKPLWQALSAHASEEFPTWLRGIDTGYANAIIRDVGEWWAELEEMPRTLIHNDFNPRNIGFRRDDDGLTLCAYDWELATIHIPQRDLAEFLAFSMRETVTKDEVDRYVELHRTALEKASKTTLDPEQWRRGYLYGLNDFYINRMGLYLMGHTFRNYKFLERVVRVLRRLIEFEL